MYISLREKEGKNKKNHVRMDLLWDRHNVEDTNGALLKCTKPPTQQHTQTHFGLRFLILCVVVLFLLLVNCIHCVLGFPVEHFVMFCNMFLMNKFCIVSRTYPESPIYVIGVYTQAVLW